MHNKWIDLSALWKIVVIGLVAGAGLPALFAIGLRSLGLSGSGAAAGAGGAARSDDEDRVIGGSVPGMIGAAICFAVVLAAIGYGVYFIVHGS